MSRKVEWRKLYLLVAVACLALFMFPPTNQAALILWLIAAYGGVALWLNANQAGIARQSYLETKAALPPVTEFYDEDRIQLQDAAESLDDDLHKSYHEEI